MNLPEQLFQWFEQRKSKLCHRQLLVITGHEKWAKQTTVTLSANSKIQNILWVGDVQGEHESINIKNYRSKLGHEYDWVVLNCFSGFRANAAMALSGTIKAQGLMILLCPDHELWPKYDDPEKINRISFGFCEQNVESQFFRYLSSAFTEDDSVAVCTKDEFSGSVAIADKISAIRQFAQQNKAIEGITRVALGHRNRPLILTADRGRGKSSALGLAAAKLMTHDKKTIWVTASHISNTEQIFNQAQRLLSMAISTQNSITYQSSTLCFKPVDQLLNSEDKLDLVLVDEAASLPIHVLIKLANKFPRIVFSSTVHGYEGSGRGFEMRFIKQLYQLKPNFKRIRMLQPIRWFNNDTLEQFWFNTLFHNVPQENKNKEARCQPVRCRHVSKVQLLSDKQLLASLFRLLIEAHYQTSQDDLQRLLDAPEIDCFILTRGSDLLGVVQVVNEGGDCFGEIANNIVDCTRRVKGHLVAQNIASSYNNLTFLLASQWRISRIAIDTKHRRKGLGTQLINFVEQQAKRRRIKCLTTSFGCNTNILKFWNRNDFLHVKLSVKPEVSSGEHSAICIKPMTKQASENFYFIHKEFYKELSYQMDKHFKNMSEDTLMQILLFSPNKTLDPFEGMEMLKQFALGNRAYSTCKRLLSEYTRNNLARLSSVTTKEQTFLVAALLQNLPDKKLCEKFNLSGKKQIEQALKTSFEKILKGL